MAVIGLDCALTHMIDQYIKEGHLPTFKKLFEKGTVADHCLTNYPTVTPPNWATIATGALAGTHGITDFHMHEPGTTLDNSNIQQAFSSERCQAEYIWDAADKAGKKSVVLNYPGSWPSNMTNGIVIGGSGLAIGEHKDGLWGLDAMETICHDQMITNGIFPNAIHCEFEEASAWEGVPEMGEDPLEMTAELNFPSAREKPAPTTWYVLVRDMEGDGYDQVTLSPSKKFGDAFCTLKLGEWSSRIFTEIKMENGSTSRVFFRCKVVELADDGEDFRLFIGGLCGTKGWTSPPEIAEEIVANSSEGTFSPTGGMRGYPVGWYGLDTFVEINDQYSQFLAEAANYVLKDKEWDIFYMHSHPPDWIYHAVMTDMDPNTCQDEDKRKAAWQAHLGIYQTQDRMLAKILEAMDKDTLVVLISDHGATADGPSVNPYDILVPAGLCAKPDKPIDMSKFSGYLRKSLEKVGVNVVPDPKKSKSIPQREIYIYVNLKGRDPDGIVEPEDYEKVQQEIIDALYTYVDPETGKRPISLALSKQDARILGLYGDRVGDVIYALYPWFGGQHGHILPTAEYGVGSLKGLFAMSGPGIKKGYRLQRTVWLTDIVPTICYLLDFPVPEQSEGAVVYQAFKDPNFKMKEIQKLKDGLARMETALERENREPWDKHDCA